MRGGPHPARQLEAMATAVAVPLALLGTTAQAQAPESYRKSWSDPAVADRIERNIEKHRKGDATITVVGRDGQPPTLPRARGSSQRC